jgi:hypothetical protein
MLLFLESLLLKHIFWPMIEGRNDALTREQHGSSNAHPDGERAPEKNEENAG